MPLAERQQRHEHPRVAIVGIGGIFPGARASQTSPNPPRPNRQTSL